MSKLSRAPLNVLATGTAPTTPTRRVGDLYYDTNTSKLRAWDGASWGIGVGEDSWQTIAHGLVASVSPSPTLSLGTNFSFSQASGTDYLDIYSWNVVDDGLGSSSRVTSSGVITQPFTLADATSGAITLTLGSLGTGNSTTGTLTVKKVDSSANAVILSAGVGDTIEGAATYSLTYQNQSVMITSEIGTRNWHLRTPTNALTLSGAAASVSASNSTIVQRHSLGYIFANYFNCTADTAAGQPAYIAAQNGDGYIRWFNPAAFTAGGASQATNATNVNGGVVVASSINAAGQAISVSARTTFQSSGHIQRVIPDTSDTNVAVSVMNTAGSSFTAYFRKNGACAGTGTYTSLSDMRAKKDIEPIEAGSLEKILALTPKTFSYLDRDETELGFVAQDVQPHIPEAVTIFSSEEDEEQLLGLRNDAILAHVVQAIQELYAMITKES